MKVAIDQEGFVVAIGSVDYFDSNVEVMDIEVPEQIFEAFIKGKTIRDYFDSNVEVMDIEVPEQIFEAFIKGKTIRYVNRQFQILTEEEFLQYLASKPKLEKPEEVGGQDKD